jgi:Concanavalin A-like lectin/glucanases superfamily
MSEPFDPYYTWLGIPPHEQPANHYRLLGISLFESNAEVISNAADRLMLHLRAFQAGKRSKESQQLLNEISAARVCLLNPEKKAAYDADVRASQQTFGSDDAHALLPPTAGDSPNVPAIDNLPLKISAKSRAAAKSRPKPQLGIWLIAASAAVLAVASSIAFIVATRNPEKPFVQARPQSATTPPAPARETRLRPNRPAVAPPTSVAPETPPAPADTTPPTENTTPLPTTPTPAPAPPPQPAPPPPVAEPLSPLAPTNPSTPSASAIADALKEIQASYATQFAAAKRPDLKVALAHALQGDVDKAGGEPVRQAALLLEAQRLALAGGDVRLAMNLLRDGANRLSADVLSESVELLKTASFPLSQRAENTALADVSSQLLDQAIATDRFDVAEPLRKIAAAAYGKVKNIDAVNRLSALQADLIAMKSEHDKLGPLLEKLAASPSDPEANLAIGRYQCFYKNDWPHGLPKLVLASDLDLAGAARKDLENPKAPAACADLAELWWNIGQKQPAAAKRNVYRRVAEWYLTALPGLVGNQRAAAVRRIDQAVPSRGDQPTALVKEGLIAYWSFDEGSGRLAQDLTKNKNHALLVGAGYERGVSGSAMQLSDVNQYAQFLGGASMRQWSVSLWVKIDQLQGEGGLLMTSGNMQGAVHIYVRGDSFVQANIVNSAGSAPIVRLEPGRWHHVVVRYGADNQTANADVWVDGAVDNKFAANKDIVPIIGPGRIGGWSEDDLNRALLGAIDDVRLYGRMLTPDEITALHSVGPAGQ